jgi:hypothetical protein
MKRQGLTGIIGCFALLLFAAVSWADPVPDTGQTKCYNATIEIPCPSPGQPFYGQDANYCIDPMFYTKLDGSSNALPDSAKSWLMVRDNVTGLIWEVKTNKDGVKNYDDPHDADNTYTWYDSNPAINGGYAGIPGNGTDTEDFVKALNDAHYGGCSDWRMPTFKELTHIVNYGIPASRPTIDAKYFPNTQKTSFYWSSTTYASDTHLAWSMNFDYGYDHVDSKNNGYYARAVRGGKSGSSGNLAIGSFDIVDSGSLDDASTASVGYTDNSDGTVTDTSTGLMWQQAGSSNIKTWDQALSYCENSTLAGYTDWRLPTKKELLTIVDYSRYNPAINPTYFPDTVSSFYWSSTTYANGMHRAWGVHFNYGYGDLILDKDNDNYVRAVRGGQSGPLDHSVLSVSPSSRNVSKDAGITIFSVSNTGAGTMSWTAAVISGGSWLSITSGNTGSNSGTIICGFSANTTTSSRTATIRITAGGATGSPVDVTVTQLMTSIACTATIDGNLSFHIPYLSYVNPISGTLSLWAELVYEFNPTYPTSILFKLTNAGIISDPSHSCAASTLSDDFKIHIPGVLLPDGSTHLWVDLEYDSVTSNEGSAYFLVTNFGFVFGIDYANPNLYLCPGEQSDLKDEYVNQVSSETGVPINNPTMANLTKIFQWYIDHFTSYAGGGALIGKVTANQIFETRLISGCHDASLIISSLLREFGFPAVMIDTASIQWAFDYHNGLTQSFVGHVLCEIYVDSKWILLDTNGAYISNYNPYNPYIPPLNPRSGPTPIGLYVMLKGIDTWGYGIRSGDDLSVVMIDFADKVESTCSILSDPGYHWVFMPLSHK